MSGPYGRACMNCSRSKCKCVWRLSNNTCERCQRLNKPCHPADSMRQRNTESRAESRIAHLEGKVDGLVSLLQSVSQSSTSRESVASALLDLGHHARDISVDRVQGTTSQARSAGTVSMSASSSAVSTTASSSTPNTGTDREPSPEEAEECLAIFRSQMLKYFAFLHLPPGMSAQQLHEQRPFLFLCVMTVSTKSTEKRMALGEEVRQTVARRMLIDNGQNVDIDLLLGLLAFLAWGHDQLNNKHRKILFRFTHFAMVLVFELRLNRPWPKDSNMLPTVGTIGTICSGPPAPATHTMEERRAVLACFLLSSTVSIFFAQTDAMRWTPYLDECLDVLSRSQEAPCDEMFAHQVRLQLFSQRARHAMWSAGDLELADAATMPPRLYLQALQWKLGELKSAFSPQLQHNEILLSSVYYTELSIHEVALHKTPTGVDGPGFQRLEGLYTCLSIVKSAVDNFFTLPVSEYPYLSFPYFAQLCRSIVILFKLATLDDPLWDTGFVRSTIDLGLVLDQLIHNLGQLSAAGGDCVNGIFAKTANIFMSVKSWYNAKRGADAVQSHDSALPMVDENSVLHEPTILQDLDDAWLREALGSWTG
ncbi:hypothetical protein A1O1_08669 [Capronia coronata CBS 617.96]|uniref:Zn(2)-C6 fungal-type domain-containing protein n=1 Tax=Capronia coronata CBS 617.96 TaxID=1182541 RepID=W9XJZ8_9EURO|nr:uncharacterized protein A1O1_08669 [Capronia coronata CBS 617.96]EXJ80523.1 hypothetical protein A1O1_08669 [Capronia coronata CBS 617.96]